MTKFSFAQSGNNYTDLISNGKPASFFLTGWQIYILGIKFEEVS